MLALLLVIYMHAPSRALKLKLRGTQLSASHRPLDRERQLTFPAAPRLSFSAGAAIAWIWRTWTSRAQHRLGLPPQANLGPAATNAIGQPAAQLDAKCLTQCNHAPEPAKPARPCSQKCPPPNSTTQPLNNAKPTEASSGAWRTAFIYHSGQWAWSAFGATISGGLATKAAARLQQTRWRCCSRGVGFRRCLGA